MEYDKCEIGKTLIRGAAVVAVTAIVWGGIYAVTESDKAAEVAKIEACVSNGGSWIFNPDGYECRQQEAQ
jgi:hypothetical protein